METGGVRRCVTEGAWVARGVLCPCEPILSVLQQCREQKSEQQRSAAFRGELAPSLAWVSSPVQHFLAVHARAQEKRRQTASSHTRPGLGAETVGSSGA